MKPRRDPSGESLAKSLASSGYRCVYCIPGRVRHVIKPRELFRVSKREEWVALEHVSINVCDRCGERYHHAYILRQAEALHVNRARSRKIKVPVARFVPVSE